MKNKKLMISIGLCIVLISTVLALEVIDPNWETDNLDIIWADQNNSWNGQIFNSSYNGTISQIDFKLNCYGAPNATSEIYIYDTKKEDSISTLGNTTKNITCGVSDWYHILLSLSM